MNISPTSRRFRRSLVILITWIALYIVVSATFNGFLIPFLMDIGVDISAYTGYINIGFALIFGYMIVRSVANTIYWSMRVKYDHPQAAAVRSMIQIVGIGALLAGIAGGTAGGAAGVALGGFIGIVVGFASQQILGQAVAGLFILIARPVRVGDEVTIAGETGKVEDITSLFIIIQKGDGTTVLIPNNMAIGSKIYIIKRYESTKA
ncbi:MAG: mechanosensitive ion channel [Desulfurococcales archaeon]|jgi:small-conductance mechanosensitive channel|nr:mechanosensitive ion channel [Desulfurococcales archaeon]